MYICLKIIINGYINSTEEVMDSSEELDSALKDEYSPFTQPIRTRAKIDSFSIVVNGDIAKVIQYYVFHLYYISLLI